MDNKSKASHNTGKPESHKHFDSLDSGVNDTRPAAALNGDSSADTQPRKADRPDAYKNGGTTPSAESAHHLETQDRNSETTKKGTTQAPRGHDEEMYPEDFNRFGTKFVDEKRVRTLPEAGY